MAYSHKFKIQAGDFICKGKISSGPEGMGYYEYDEDTIRPTSELDNTLSEIIERIGKFLKANGSIEKFEVKPINEE